MVNLKGNIKLEKPKEILKDLDYANKLQQVWLDSSNV